MAAESVAFTVTTHALHVGCFALWIGGLAVLIASPTIRTDPFRLARFSRLALRLVTGLTATGLVLSWIFISNWLAHLITTYGRILSAKLILFLIVLGIAWKNKRLVHQIHQDLRPTLTDRLLIRRIWFEIVGLSLITTLAVWLAHQMPPTDAY